MNLTTYSLSAIRTPKAVHFNAYNKYKQSVRAYEQGFNFNYINALYGIYNSSINNYTSQYLTGNKKLSDFIIQSKKNNKLQTLTTPSLTLTDTLPPSTQDGTLIL
jgi:predicted subunit of tRNA(5-methylaminomethyl-2-thiouridylate) methyltransferase